MLPSWLYMGGDDASCVAEATLSVLEMFESGAYKEYQELVEIHGHEKVFDEVKKLVSTM